MAQNQQTGLLGQYLTVNTAANTITFSSNSNIATAFNVGGFGNTTTGGFVANASVLAIGNSSVNVVVNSSSVYVNGSPLGGAVNVAAQFAWTNTHSFSGVVTHNANVVLGTAGISANGSYGTANQVLTSNGSTTFWASASGGFTNGQSISVNNFVVSGTVTANGSAGAAGQTLVSNGAGVNWSSLVPSYNYSAQFNGSSSLTLPGSTALTFGTGDFTIEFWFKTAATLQYTSFISNEIGGAGYTLLFNTVTNDGKFVLYDSTLGSPLFTTSTGGYNDNNWHHFALVRIGTAFSMYVDGVSRASATSSGTIAGGTNTIYIGASSIAGRGYNGFISNWRMVKGVGVYTGAFTVPTSPLQTTQAAGTNIAAITGTQTSLLTCNALTLTDSSPNLNVITNNGGVVASATSNPPFTYSSVSIPTTSLTSLRQSFTGDGTTTVFNIAGGYTPGTLSVYYNGLMLRNGSDVTATNGATIIMAVAPQSGALIDVVGTVPTTYSSITPVSYSTQFTTASSQYLSIPANAAFQMTADFTIEFFAYITSFASYPVILDQYVAGTTGAGNWQIGFLTSGVLQLYYDGSSFVNCSTLSLNTWYHIAAVRIGSSIKIYINGVLAATQAFAGTLGRSDTTLWIGAQHASGPVNYTSAYISNVRIVKGLGVYTSNFTVPTSPLAMTQSASGAYIQAITGTQTSLLTCNAPTIIDGSTNVFTITNNGAASVSTAIVPTFTNVTINNTITTAATYSVQALLIGGGGAGGAGEPNPGGDGGGGGGSGGVIQNNINLSIGTVYSIVIGAGGSGGSTTGGNGANTTFAGLTAYGGGGGGDGNGTTPGFGGSGGGAGNEYSASTWSGGCVYGQGYPGGPSVSASTSWRGGSGGGGAGGFGTSRTSAAGGNGGSSISLAITGSTVFYAGGGAGGACGTNGGGTGGNGFGVNQGGGGNGGSTGAVPGTGTTNTGGGGGGGVGHNVGTSYTYGASGGSGLVILSIPTANYTGTKTGSPTVTTSGSYTILTFTASGSYTA